MGVFLAYFFGLGFALSLLLNIPNEVDVFDLLAVFCLFAGFVCGSVDWTKRN